MADPDRDSPAPARPEKVEAIRFFDTPTASRTAPPMSDTRATPRSEPVLEMMPPPESGSGEPLRVASEPVVLRVREPAPEVTAAHAPAPERPGASEQLARLEDKAARIEEKLARSESNTQRVVDRFELASARMGEVALQSDLAAVRAEIAGIGKRVRGLPGFTALVYTAVITAVLTSALTVAVMRFLPGLLTR